MRIEIRLNGEPCEISAPLNIAELLDRFDLPKDRVAVERNRSIVPKQQWDSVALAEGDELMVENLTRQQKIRVRHFMPPRQVQILLRGGLINWMKERLSSSPSLTIA